MNALTDDERALLAAIRGDDSCEPCSGRGVLADWYDEVGMHERAEFVRVQCELARRWGGNCRACGKRLGHDRIADGCPCNSPRGVNHGLVPAYVCTCPECDPKQTGSVRDMPFEVDQLCVRQSVIFSARRREWEPPCVWCAGHGVCRDCVHWKGRVPADCRCGGSRRCHVCKGAGTCPCTWLGGVVVGVAVPSLVSVLGPCGRCGGTGNEDAQKIPDDPLPCRACAASGYVPTPWAARLARDWPAVSRVLPLDRAAYRVPPPRRTGMVLPVHRGLLPRGRRAPVADYSRPAHGCPEEDQRRLAQSRDGLLPQPRRREGRPRPRRG